MPDKDFILWVLVVAYALHILEEYFMDWRDWAEKLAGRCVTWTEFYLINAAVVLTGISTAAVGWKFPAYSLMFPALMLINSIFVHFLPALFRRRYNPGLLTSILFFIPLGMWAYLAAGSEGVLTPVSVGISLAGGAVMMLVPLLLQRFKRI